MTTTISEGEQILANYDLCLVGPRRMRPAPPVRRTNPWTEDVQLYASFLRETEENLTDLLPPGYRVEIRETKETP